MYSETIRAKGKYLASSHFRSLLRHACLQGHFADKLLDKLMDYGKDILAAGRVE
jgi:hypothetical protein